MHTLLSHRQRTFVEQSSEHDASSVPLGSHVMAFTSSWGRQTHPRELVRLSLVRSGPELARTSCPVNVLLGDVSPMVHTWIDWSVEHDANVQSSFQSTSSVGALWNLKVCFTLPVAASHTTAVVSTLPLSRYVPLLFHFSEKIGPLCSASVARNEPAQPSPQEHTAR